MARRPLDYDRYGEEGARRPGAGARLLVPVLAAILGLLVLGVAAGSVYGLATHSRAKMLARGGSALPAGSKVFTGLGTLRASTADKPPAVVVATPSFPYPASDQAFGEELQAKLPALRQAVVAYLSARKAADLHPAFEGAVKAGIRDALNGLLDLGKVDTVWLSDFSVIQ